MNDLKKIKNEYGEGMMYFLRENFPTELEVPGLLYTALTSKFYPSKLIYEDIKNNSEAKEAFITVLMDELHKDDENDLRTKTNKTPAELLKEKGYILYECKTEEDIQSFRHYYKREDGQILPKYVPGTVPPRFNGEELCTFNGDRLDRCYVFFAVTENADQIKREDYVGKEARQDPYGTSVISIQFLRGDKNTLSIKNRYNHTVAHPDSTFRNELDNIIPGLTDAFEREYGLNINPDKVKRNIEIPGYVKAKDGRYYKYNYEEFNIYYCPDNIVIEFGEVKHLDKSRYLLIDGILIDFQTKEIRKYNCCAIDAFTDFFNRNEANITSIKVENNKEAKEKVITINDDIVIIVNNKNQIIYYKNDHITEIGSYFLAQSTEVKNVDLPNVESIRTDFISNSTAIEKIILPKCKRVGNNFLYKAITPKEISLPEVVEVGNNFLNKCILIENLNLPNCRIIGNCFMQSNLSLEEIDLPSVIEVGDDFLKDNARIKKVNLPNCKKIKSGFLENNRKATEIVLPEVEEIDDDFMGNNEILGRIILPKCKKIGNVFLVNNLHMEEIYMPEVEEIGYFFMGENRSLKKLELPNVKRIGKEFLYRNTELEELIMPDIAFIETDFLPYNKKLEELNFPQLLMVGSSFLYSNEIIKKVLIPNCKVIADSFLKSAKNLQELDVSDAEGFELTNIIRQNKDVKIILNKKEDNNDEKGESSGSKQI